ncbi:hypothetical protein CDD82_819 [Ophiocordyceps australis]|uniref:Clr5 domain-containing protein n=1 Tax=Ophiocordyceps australis TaxID=1399860 RepID=A0A2C5Y0I9_9HYPO|nr:hypothetical protein CDD82_819 [Ophiocordyceps australis]
MHQYLDPTPGPPAPPPIPPHSSPGGSGQHLSNFSTSQFLPSFNDSFAYPSLSSPFSQYDAQAATAYQQGGANNSSRTTHHAQNDATNVHIVPMPPTYPRVANATDTLSTRQSSTRNPRTRQPGQRQWEKNKAHIEQLYMKDDLPLPEVVRRMEKDHDFCASEKMYKNKFKAWAWSKNLPREKAMWMGDKIRQRRPAATVFHWNHQNWSEDRIMQICARFSQTQPESAQPAAYARTPDMMKDIQYWTPPPVSDTPQTPRNEAIMQSQDRENQERSPRQFYLDTPPVNLDMNHTTVSDLEKLLESASRAASDGNLNEADADFRDVVAGFCQLLSPTHEETLKAAYLYASFYANSGEMNKADAVLSWMFEKHREKWGLDHAKTYQHYASMIKLLYSWGRTKLVESLMGKLLKALDIDNDETHLDLTHPVDRGAHDLAEPLDETDNPGSIHRQFDIMDLAALTDTADLGDVVQTIIKHRDEAGCEDLGLQACRLRS